jgi:hypothetical protein
VFNTNSSGGSPLQINHNPTNLKKINNINLNNNNTPNSYSNNKANTNINIGYNSNYRIPNKIETSEKSNIPNGISTDPNLYGNKIENFQRQQILRRLLKEFGLGQYLRVILK